ncbi:MAG TPA: Type 1 glutamine amidotransferase-like domain-containing protein [bacterium]|nr:Type 1 glutamine amidotransferase-like domain-containing protein [bacterium]HNZ73263.1 Type 1 glutamine amidotransferase-like domain-containing protein [bacterium]
MAIITTASAEYKEKNKHAVLAKQVLEDMGFKKVKFLDIEFENPNKLKKFDVIYINGGNPFYLLHHLKKSGADKIIIHLANKRVIIVEISGGGVVLSPNINIVDYFDKKANVVKLKDLTALNLVVMVVMVAWPDFIIKEVNIRPGLEKEIIFTQYYWLYFIYISFLFTFGFYRLFIKYRKSAGIEKQQILYLFLGDALSANSAFVTNLIMPWIGYFFLNWLGQVFTITMVGFASYAIIRYRLMDIRIVARKIYIYFGIATFTYGMFYLIAWIYQNKLGSIFSTTGYLVGLIIAPLFVIVFYSVERLLKITANKYLFVSLYNYQETINKLTDELNYYIDLDKIISLIVDTIKKTMQLDRAGVLLINQQVNPVHYQIAKEPEKMSARTLFWPEAGFLSFV